MGTCKIGKVLEMRFHQFKKKIASEELELPFASKAT